MKTFKFIILLFLIVYPSYSQNKLVKGKVIDANKKPIDYATVLLQNNEKSYQKVVLTDTLGNFAFDRTNDDNYLLILQHIAYDTDTIIISPERRNPDVIVLYEKKNVIQDVIVTGERPIMKVQNNTLIYNIQPLLQSKSVLNAFEAVKEVPGVIEESGGTLSLAGGDNLKIVIDGQNTSLSLKQMISILKSTPSSKIEKIELSYNAPAQYNTKGALINIILNSNNTKQPFTGELSGTFMQSYYPSLNKNLSLSYNHDKLRIDVMGSFNIGKSWNKSDALTRQYFENNTFSIDEKTENTSKYVGFNPRIGINYNIDKDKKIVFSYYLNSNNDKTINNSDAFYRELSEYRIISKNNMKTSDYLNNFYLEYSSKKINIGTDIILYNNITDRDFQTAKNNEDINILNNKSTQKVYKHSIFFNYNLNPSKNIKFNYGINAEYNKADTQVDYNIKQNSTSANNEYIPIEGKQIEYNFNSYVEAEYKANSKLFLSSSLKSEYFNSKYNNNGVESVLWSGWTFYPNATVTYSFDTNNMLQFTIYSNKRYPSFWAVNPQTTNLSSYTQIEGNSHLKPSQSYLARLLYNYKRKYMFSISYSNVSNFFIQMPHMSENGLKIIHRYENFDTYNNLRAMISIPFRIKDFLNSRLILQGYRKHEEIKHFYGSSFNNVYYNGMVGINNSFKLTPKFLFQLNGTYNSPSRQGVYILGESWNLDSRLEWKVNAQSSLVFYYNNILQHQMPRPLEVKYSNQYRWSRDYERSSIGLTFLWKFNQYEAENYKSPDNSRLE